jgi:hypothetical protein
LNNINKTLNELDLKLNKENNKTYQIYNSYNDKKRKKLIIKKEKMN